MFPSFFLAGFECTTGINARHQWIDQIEATAHDLLLDDDYHLVRSLGMRAIREGVRWPLIDRSGVGYDFTSLRPFIEAARRHHLQVIWDLFHYGYPHDADPLDPAFSDRFSDYCAAAARYIAQRSDGPWYFTPVNEPSYLAWAAGEAARFAPHRTGCGPALKVELIRAAIAGIDAIRSVCPGARMVNADPLCRVVPPLDRPDLADGAEAFNQGPVFESWDMLCGRLHPELGGSREHLDIVGINYYWTNQWEIGREGEPLAPGDHRLATLHDLIAAVHRRYGGDLMISETGHAGDQRGAWIDAVAEAADAAIADGIPLRGICLYPVLGMPEWHEREAWARMGLWDVVHDAPGMPRVAHQPAIAALRRAQARDRLRMHADAAGMIVERGGARA